MELSGMDYKVDVINMFKRLKKKWEFVKRRGNYENKPNWNFLKRKIDI